MGAFDLIRNKYILTFLLIVGGFLLFLSVNKPEIRTAANIYLAVVGFGIVGAIALPRLGVRF